MVAEGQQLDEQELEKISGGGVVTDKLVNLGIAPSGGFSLRGAVKGAKEGFKNTPGGDNKASRLAWKTTGGVMGAITGASSGRVKK
jgi:hypothetical protein